PPRDVEEQRRFRPDRNKTGSLYIELSNGMRQSRTLQHARDGDDHAHTAAGHRGTVLTIPHVARAKFAGAAVDDGQTRGPDQRTQLAIEDFISDAEFTAPSGVVANIETASGPFVAEH